MNLRRRTTCRVCGSNQLETVIDLGNQYLQGAFVKPGMALPPDRQIPCELVRCCPDSDENACGLLQMRHSVPPAILYSDYWYKSGVNETMRRHLKGIVSEAVDLRAGLAKAPRVLDIGCNDGTLLKAYWDVMREKGASNEAIHQDSFTRVGVDPASMERTGIEGIEIIEDLFPTQHVGGRLFDIVTSIAMFYDVEDPVEFARSVKSILAQDGVWIIEVSYMPQMLANNGYDTICHEHLEYYSFAVLENIMRRVGLKVFRAELNECNGGSIRCYITYAHSVAHDRSEWQQDIRNLRVSEFNMELEFGKPYFEFQERIEKSAQELFGVILDFHQQGKTVHVLGASTKGNTILQFARLSNRTIECAADRNPEKHGASTLGTNIPIVSEEESRAMQPGAYLCLPWHFRKELLEREAAALEDGVAFIFPLPTVEVFSK